MNQNRLPKLSIYFLLIVICTNTTSLSNIAHSQDTDPIFTLQTESPIIEHHPNDRGTDGGAIIYHDGLFHMFHNGFRTWPGDSVLRYSTSTDGLNWEAASDQPVFTTAEVDYAEVMMAVSSGLVLEDGTWVLYFFTWKTLSIQYGPGEIGRATASAPTGPWTPDPEPILIQGGAGEWDSGQLSIPSVVQLGDGTFRMVYTASDESGFMQIGMATSDDGIVWSKYDDPSTSEAPYAESDPVLLAGESGEWDDNAVYQPNIILTSDGWVMVYKSFSSRGSDIGIATSDDGFIWTKFAANPILRSQDVPAVRGFGLPELLLHDETAFLYIPVGTSALNTDLYLATHDGPFIAD